MKELVILSQDDPFFLPNFYSSFLENLPSEKFDLKKVYFRESISQSKFEKAQQLLNFYGIQNFSKLLFRYILSSFYSSLGKNNYSVRNLLRSHSIDSTLVSDFQSDQFAGELRSIEPDILLSVSCPEILPEKILAIPRDEAFNVHSAELPKYRGLMPTFWALYHDEEEVGLTIHTMEKEVDRGQILKQESLPIRENESLHHLLKRVKTFSGRETAKALTDYVSGNYELTEMGHEGETYFSFPKRTHAREVERKGHDLI